MRCAVTRRAQAASKQGNILLSQRARCEPRRRLAQAARPTHHRNAKGRSAVPATVPLILFVVAA